ncbi:MAG: hypothetical protein WCP55_19350 [Lentisphaerota bacterium]
MEPVTNPRKGRHAIGAEAGWQRRESLRLCACTKTRPAGIAQGKLIVIDKIRRSHPRPGIKLKRPIIVRLFPGIVRFELKSTIFAKFAKAYFSAFCIGIRFIIIAYSKLTVCKSNN